MGDGQEVGGGGKAERRIGASGAGGRVKE